MFYYALLCAIHACYAMLFIHALASLHLFTSLGVTDTPVMHLLHTQDIRRPILHKRTVNHADYPCACSMLSIHALS